MNDKISVLIAARKNSKYLAKFLHGLYMNTQRRDLIEVLVMLNAEDDWNNELVRFYEDHTDLDIRFMRENYGYGRAGLHYYLNDLYRESSGDWIVYFCEDHFINYMGWDMAVRKIIEGVTTVKTEIGQIKKHDLGRLHPRKIWCIVPKFDNAGAMNQILSRAYCEAIGDKVGGHGWIDSYINDVNRNVFGDFSDRVIRMDDAIFHDFTHDKPSPMSDAHLQSVTSPEGKRLPTYGSTVYKHAVAMDSNKLNIAVAEGK